ncbi:Heterokaryon incompatibility [Niveomyces insectorum RCEF 264]|uniref:Heterokaryon incompatibility n=1 Tax=Niveomyces insectorum RCEF 264 TaxID=1081102 RepID=A0A167RXL7_9HYPO|nr:Heterokaryon incompatibility [Niveomyces insectorum RCEF 264]
MSRRVIKTGLWDNFKDNFRDGRKKAWEEHPDDQLQDRTRNERITEPYQYSPLTADALSIRLATLLPGTRQQNVAIHLYEARLDTCAGSYEALSYVWQDTRAKTPILVDGYTLEVGANLRCALLNLRRPDAPRTLWIDAICINQASIGERNQQVAAMGTIYQQASQTVVWLCDQTAETAAAFAMLDDLADEATKTARPQPAERLLLVGGDVTDAEEDGEDTAGLQAVDRYRSNFSASLAENDDVRSPLFARYKNDISIMHLLASRWWWRAWTAQEILLAARATVTVGRYTMDWDRLCTGGNHGLRLGIWMPLLMGLILDPIIMPYLSVQSLRWQQQQHHRRRRQPRNGPAAVTPGQELLDLLIRCRFRQSTDPRDKIYSVLGLLTSHEPSPSPSPSPPLSIQPDYASPMGAVYAHVARQILLESGTLDLLGACAVSATTDGATNTPSWVPDWSKTNITATPLTRDAFGRSRKTHATRHSTAAPRFLDEGHPTLVVRAHAVTTLTALAAPLARIQFDSLDEMGRSALDRSQDYDGSRAAKRAALGRAWQSLLSVYEVLMSVVPHLGTYAEWEAFARAVPPTNPVPAPRGCRAARRSIESQPSPPSAAAGTGAIGRLIRSTSDMILADDDEDEEPDDPLAVYWQTLCTGTYASEADTDDGVASAAPSPLRPPTGRGPKIATQQLFYSWRASLKPIRHLHQLRAERRLRLLGFVGYVRKTWRGYGAFMRFVEGTYERRLARGANGYLCLVPAAAKVGDTIVLAEGGRVPLVVRPDGGSSGDGEHGGDGSAGYWRLVGEAYVQGIADGQAWDAARCVDFKLR